MKKPKSIRVKVNPLDWLTLKDVVEIEQETGHGLEDAPKEVVARYVQKRVNDALPPAFLRSAVRTSDRDPRCPACRKNWLHGYTVHDAALSLKRRRK